MANYIHYGLTIIPLGALSAHINGGKVYIEGSAQEATLRPSGAGLYAEYNWVEPSDGIHWDKVDEVVADDAATWVCSQYNDLRDLYAVPASGIPAGSTINWVRIYIRHYTELGYIAAGGVKTKIGFNDGVEDWWEATGHEPSPEATWVNADTGTLTTNPRTSSAWTLAQINALQIGVRQVNTVVGYFCRPTQVYVVENYSPPTLYTISTISDHIFTASKDTYIDVGVNSVVDFNEVANDATAPSLAASHIRIARVRTDSEKIVPGGVVNLAAFQ